MNPNCFPCRLRLPARTPDPAGAPSTLGKDPQQLRQLTCDGDTEGGGGGTLAGPGDREPPWAEPGQKEVRKLARLHLGLLCGVSHLPSETSMGSSLIVRGSLCSVGCGQDHLAAELSFLHHLMTSAGSTGSWGKGAAFPKADTGVPGGQGARLSCPSHEPLAPPFPQMLGLQCEPRRAEAS